MSIFIIIHWVLTVYVLGYALVVYVYGPSKWDAIYIAYIILLHVHWLFNKNECIISLYEKKEVDPDYKVGQCPYIHPYTLKLNEYIGTTVATLLAAFFLVPVVFVLVRTCLIGTYPKIALIVFILSYALYSLLNNNNKTDPYCNSLLKQMTSIDGVF